MRRAYKRARITIKEFALEDIICDSLTDDGTGEEDDYGGEVSGGGDTGW